MRREVVGRIVLFVSSFVLASAQAATYYVSTGGNDGNPGTSAQPFRTIIHAYSLAAAGTTIIVNPGTYTDYNSGWGIHLGKSGTGASPIVLRSLTPGGAVIDGQNATDRNVGFYIDGTYNVVDGFDIKSCPREGITLWADNNQILNCNIHDNAASGIYSSETTSGNRYSANYIAHNGTPGTFLDHGMYLCGKNELVNDNVVCGNTANGIQVAGYTTVSNMKLYNNVMAFNGANGIILWQTLNGVDIKNNSLYANGHYAIGSYDAHGSGVAVDHNLSFGNGYGNFNFADGGSTYSYTLGTALYGNPGFVNGSSASFDAHLAAGSPAILAGVNLSSTFTTDIVGASWPASGAWDLGACKYGSTGTVTNPATTTVSVVASIPTAVLGTTNYGAFTFTRTGSTSSALTVNYALGGTAVKWNDYYRPTQGDMPVSIVIPAGAAAYTMSIAARDN